MEKWPTEARWKTIDDQDMHEATLLKLDISRAIAALDWRPRWSLEQAIDSIVDWYRTWSTGGDIQGIMLSQISDFEKNSKGLG